MQRACHAWQWIGCDWGKAASQVNGLWTGKGGGYPCIGNSLRQLYNFGVLCSIFKLPFVSLLASHRFLDLPRLRLLIGRLWNWWWEWPYLAFRQKHVGSSLDLWATIFMSLVWPTVMLLYCYANTQTNEEDRDLTLGSLRSRFDNVDSLD